MARWLEDASLITLLMLMVALAIGRIVMRNLLDTGVAWGDPLLRVLVLWVGLAGAIVATREDKHIAINILTHLLPRRLRLVSRLFADLFTATVSGIVAWYSAQFLMSEYESGTIAFGNVPVWVCELILPLAFGAITLRILALAAGRVWNPLDTRP